MNTLAAKCGFGENHYKFDQGNVMTATQVISENSTLFRVLKKHEIILENVLKSLVRIVVRIGIQVLKQPFTIPELDEITIDFDDSIIEDQRTEFNDMRQDVAAGLLRPELYVAKRYGVSEEEAKELDAESSGLAGGVINYAHSRISQQMPGILCPAVRVEDFILQDIARRIAKAGKSPDTAQWQMLRLKELGMATGIRRRSPDQ